MTQIVQANTRGYAGSFKEGLEVSPDDVSFMEGLPRMPSEYKVLVDVIAPCSQLFFNL